MKKALVTGANGFIGSALVRELVINGVEVIALTREGCMNNIHPEARVALFELSKSSEMLETITDRDIDVFYHLAWIGSAGTARTDTVLQLSNAQWTVDCLRVAKKLNCKKFVCAGSIMEREVMAVMETQGYKPGEGYFHGSGIYGSGKLAAHNMCIPVAADVGIDLIWAKITNAYGVGEISPRFVNTTIRKIISNELLRFTSATQNYDFVYIDDIARAFRLLGEYGRPFCDYTIGSSHAQPLKNFILEMKEAIAPDKDFIFGEIPFTGANLPLADYDTSLLEKDTGFKAQISFGDGTRKTMEWLQEIEK